MNGNEKYKGLVSHLSTLLLWAALTGMFAYLWYEHYIDFMKFTPFGGKGNLLILAVYVVLLYIFSHIYGANKVGYLRLSEVVYSQFLSIFITNFIAYCQLMLVCRQFLNPGPILLLTIADFVVSTIWSYFMTKLYFRLNPARKILIIYGPSGESTLQDFIRKLGTRPEKFQVEETIGMVQGLDAVFKRADTASAVVIYDVKTPERNKILKYCFERKIRVYLTPKISDIIVRGATALDLFDTPLLLCRNHGLTFEQRIAKRLFDIFVSLVLILLSSPIMLVVAISIKLTDRGPVFFRQDRCTVNGKVFSILKFRSMIVDAEKEGKSIPATDNDPRITKVGKIIRKTRVDELPQLFNILQGDMSIVGPRPERVEHVEKYSEEVPEFRYRLKVKGGLTGYAQVAGKYNTTPYDKLKLDLMYIENYSFLLDLKLIFKTVKVMFMKESTEGFEEKKLSESGEELDD